MTPPPWLTTHPAVAAALRERRPVVALESTVITHGLPRPTNLELAREMEAEVREGGAMPATVAMLDGRLRLGLSSEDLRRLANAEDAKKISHRDLGVAAARQFTGGTTVAASLFVAHAAGIRVFATGGIGGVHRGESGDVSSDLPALARTPVAVVCAGAKAILDLPRTVEWLETAGVPVLGWKTDEFPAFFTRESGLAVNARLDSAGEAAAILRTHWGLGLESSALICVPCPDDLAIPRKALDAALEAAEAKAHAKGIVGKDLTPFLLARLVELTDGATLRANLALLRQNARIATELAIALTNGGGC